MKVVWGFFLHRVNTSFLLSYSPLFKYFTGNCVSPNLTLQSSIHFPLLEHFTANGILPILPHYIFSGPQTLMTTSRKLGQFGLQDQDLPIYKNKYMLCLYSHFVA